MNKNKIISFAILVMVLFSQSLAIDSRTLGGEIVPVSDKSKPWLVNFNNSCSASLINERFILTAFHCIYSSSIEDIKEQSSVKFRGSDKTSKIKNVYLPYKESPMNFQADIAVIELSDAIKIDSYIKIPNEDFLDKYYGKQDASLLLGYGANDIDAVLFVEPTQLKLSIMDRASCDKLMLEEGRTKMEDNLNYLVCDNAKADRKRRGKATGMCAGDSGGPLTIQEDGVFYQIGTVSGYSQDGGSELCGENSAFYGSVAHHSKWINNILANKVAPNLDYEVVDVSIEGRMYKVMKQSKKGEWSMMGLTNGTFLEVEKMPSKFLIYTYRDNEFIKYNEYSGDIKIHRIEGFWFSKR